MKDKGGASGSTTDPAKPKGGAASILNRGIQEAK